jgi:hypothetical protein
MSRFLVRTGLCATALVAAAFAQAAGPGDNLIVNGDAEAGMAGWTAFGGVDLFSAVAYGPNWVQSFQPGPEERGLNLFVGGSGVAYVAAYQLADLSAFAAAELGSGQLGYSLQGWLGGWLEQSDNAQLTVQFLDTQSAIVGTAVLGPAMPQDRGNETGLFFFSTAGQVPVGTSAIQFVLEMARTSGGDNDGYADNLSFTLAPVPEPAPAALLLAGLGVLTLLRRRGR